MSVGLLGIETFSYTNPFIIWGGLNKNGTEYLKSNVKIDKVIQRVVK